MDASQKGPAAAGPAEPEPPAPTQLYLSTARVSGPGALDIAPSERRKEASVFTLRHGECFSLESSRPRARRL